MSRPGPELPAITADRAATGKRPRFSATQTSSKTAFEQVQRAEPAGPANLPTGCTDSPENPTVVLALVGGAGALFSAGARIEARRNLYQR